MVQLNKNSLEKINLKINKIFNSSFFLIIIGIFILLKTLFFYDNTIAISEEINNQVVIGTIIFIMAIMCAISLLPNKVKIVTTIIIDTLISILLYADNLYFDFSNNMLSVAQISNIQYGDQIMATLPVLLEFKQILYFLDILIIIILLAFKELKIERKKEVTKKQQIIKFAVGSIGAIVFCALGSNYVSQGTKYSYNKNMQVRKATIYGYHIADIINSINFKNQAKYKTYDEMIKQYDELKENLQTTYGKEQYDFKNTLSGKNIIIVQLESIQEFVINKKINAKEITPNFNKFVNENIEFSNMNMQSYSTTADSEHSVMNSIYPMENGMSFSKYYTNTYDDIFKLYNKNNYFTAYMHGNYPTFWNRENVYGRLGINKLEFKEQFSDLSENINGDLSDELLYKQAVEKMEEYKTPFLVNIVSVSSHTPFTLEGLQDRNKISIDVGKYKDTYFGNYLEAVNYADYAFGEFINNLKQKGLYEDSAILIYGDHNGISMYDEELIDFLKQLNPELNDIDIKLNYTKVLCGLKLPGKNNHIEISKPVSKLDIKPTLCYLSGIEDGISLGTNMFENKDYVCLNNERIINDKYYFDENWYEISTGKKVDLDTLSQEEKEKLENYYNNMKKELDISISISINNLLKNK